MIAWNFDLSQEAYKDLEPFLVLCPANSIADFVILQVSKFEGRMYPDAMDACIDYDDGVTNAVAWMPCPELSTEQLAAHKFTPTGETK